ncbi:MAG TPA: ABC transporter ATP-binding protein [Candidatus Binataceae bacterium]|nr:ABC transporter ATP-binding protein [Candidatus Binataceae bacterium]
MNSTFRRYLATIIEVSRWNVIRALVLMVGFSLTEGIGIALLLPTLEVAGLNLVGQGAAGRYASAVRAALASFGLHADLLLLLGIFVVLAGLRTLLGRMQSVASYRVEQDFEDSMRRRLYASISNANWLFVSRTRVSDFTHALTAEIERVSFATFMLMQLGTDVVISMLYVAIAFSLSPAMTLLVLGSALVLVVAFRGRTQAIEETGQEVSSTTKSLYAAISDHLLGLKTAKAYGAERDNARIFSALSREVAESNVSSAREQAHAAALFELGSVAILAVVLFVAIRVIRVPSAAILILLLLFARVMPRLMSVHRSYRIVINAMPSFVAVLALEARCIEAAEPVDSIEMALRFDREIAIDGASFAYDGVRGEALHAVGLTLPAGSKVALVGPSGAGKSTIADLIMGLLSPDRGAIRIDDVELTPARARAWRECIGYVASDTFLFHDTIRANLKWAKPNASDGEIRAALASAAASDFVAALPARLDTVVGDRGVMLSQGERQRLALARAFLRSPALLVLDEATNSLDAENEARILAAIAERGEKLTVVIIAHRLSTIRWADFIYVVENGSIVESGRFDELSTRREGRFRALCEAQSLNL